MVNAQQLHQLDILIAKAMGKEEAGSAKDVQGNMVCYVYHSKDDCDVPFQPTRNPTDAMEVQQWLLTQEHTFFVRSFKHGKGFLFGLVDETLNGESLWVETLPLAICLFAERVIGQSKEK